MKSIPPYLREVLEEATEYHKEDEGISQVSAAHEIAHQNDSLIRMDEGERDALDVLQDIRRIHSLCADEFETYRQGRNTDYTDSILEAVALRSLEELINVHLNDDQTLDCDSAIDNREVEYLGIDNHDVVANIQIHVTAKEAVDIDNAIGNLVGDLDPDHPRVSELQQLNLLWKGGINELNDTTVMLTSSNDVELLLEALARYEPREADFTTELRHAVLETIAAPESHIDPDDVETFSVDEPKLATN